MNKSTDGFCRFLNESVVWVDAGDRSNALVRDGYSEWDAGKTTGQKRCTSIGYIGMYDSCTGRHKHTMS